MNNKGKERLLNGEPVHPDLIDMWKEYPAEMTCFMLAGACFLIAGAVSLIAIWVQL